MKTSRYLVLTALAALAGCSEPEEPCRFDGGHRTDSLARWNCANAHELASRDSPNLFVTQPELDLYLDVYMRAFEPIAPVLMYAPQADYWWGGATIVSDRPELVAAWSSGRVATGLDELDRLLEASHIDYVIKAGGEGNYFFPGSTTHTAVARNLAPRITALGLADIVGEAEEFRFTEPGGEVIVEAVPGGAETPVLFQIGWGDCIVDCDGQHFWRVVVTPSAATLTEEWGDEIPAHVLDLYRSAPPYEYRD